MRTIISIIFGLVVVLGVSVCASATPTSTNSPVWLTPTMFDGYEFTLISDKAYLYYLFLGDGVSESFGEKGSGVVGLDEGWRIDHGNTLVFLGAEPSSGANPNPVRHTMQFKSFGEKIVVTTDGERFKRSKFKRPD
jgi:hypothetical protein